MRTALSIAGMLLSVSPSHAWFWGDKTYEECMVSQMKGQAQTMYQMVNKVCSRKFNREVDIWASETKWSFSIASGVANIEIDDGGEYEVTGMKVRFAPLQPDQKECKDLSERDWGDVQNVSISRNRGTGSARNAVQSSRTCMKVEEIRGKYK